MVCGTSETASQIGPNRVSGKKRVSPHLQPERDEPQGVERYGRDADVEQRRLDDVLDLRTATILSPTRNRFPILPGLLSSPRVTPPPPIQKCNVDAGEAVLEAASGV